MPETLDQYEIEARCFTIDIHAEFNYMDASMQSIAANITLNLGNPRSFHCYDYIQISTAFNDHVYQYFHKGSKSINILFTDLRDVIDIHKNGLKFFTYCAGPFEVLSSTFMTALLWTGGEGVSPHVPVFGTMPTSYQVEGNQFFLQSFSGQEIQERVITEVVIDFSIMQTGDLLVARRWTGFPTEIMILSGGFASHVAMIVKGSSGDIWVIEAQPNQFFDEGVSGVQRHKIEDWMLAQKAAGSDVAWLRLKDSIRKEKTFRTQQMMNWVASVSASPYNYVREIFAAVDSSANGYPVPFNHEYIPTVIRLFY